MMLGGLRVHFPLRAAVPHRGEKERGGCGSSASATVSLRGEMWLLGHNKIRETKSFLSFNYRGGLFKRKARAGLIL